MRSQLAATVFCAVVLSGIRPMAAGASSAAQILDVFPESVVQVPAGQVFRTTQNRRDIAYFVS